MSERQPDRGLPGLPPSGIRLPVWGLFVLISVYLLEAARPLLLPMVLAWLASLLLAPAVNRLARWRVPREIGAGVVLALLLAALTGLFGVLQDPLAEWMGRTPATLERLIQETQLLERRFESLARTGEEVESMMERALPDEQGERIVVRRDSWREVLLSVTWELLATVALALALAYFLLVGGDKLILRTLHQLPSRESRRRLIAAVRETRRCVVGYLAVLSAVNVVVGILTGIALQLLGIPNPWVWGIMSGLFRYIPYIGLVIVAAILGVITWASLQSAVLALAVPAAWVVFSASIGVLVEPFLYGARMAVSPVVVFLFIFFWGGLWGLPGALLAVPLASVFHAVMRNVPALEPVARIVAR